MKLASSLLVFLFSITIFAGEISPQSIFDKDGNRLDDSDVNSPDVAWELVDEDDGQDYRGIGLLRSFFFGGGCSATFLDVGGGPKAPAYILTNGHCLSPMPKPDEFVIDKRAGFGKSFVPEYFHDFDGRRKSFSIARIEYGTMTGTDLAILKLDATVGDFTDMGIKGFQLATDVAPFGQEVFNIGIPQSGVRDAFLRKSACTILESTDLLEGGYLMHGSYRNQCSVVGGSSGSSLFARDTLKIVAIINTGVDDRSPTPCKINHPCEVDDQGNEKSFKEYNYAQRTHIAAGCFNDEGTFDLDLKSCELDH